MCDVNLGGWESKEGLEAFRTPPTIELHSVEDKWADGLHYHQFLLLLLVQPM